MKAFYMVIVFGFICLGCLKPPLGEYDDAVHGEVESTDNRTDESADDRTDENTDLADESKDVFDAFDESCAKDEVDADTADDQDLSGEAEVESEATDELDIGNESNVGKEIDALESETCDETELLGDTDAEVDLDIPDEESLPDINCPPGYSWDAEKGKCVSFCPADQYFEAKLMKCVFYPCCDLTGAWKASVLDSDMMVFTIYDLQVDQTISYLQALLTLDSPPEVAECSGSLEKKELVLYCTSESYSLQLSSTTVDGTGKFSGFYSYSYKKGGVKAGPVNFEKK